MSQVVWEGHNEPRAADLRQCVLMLPPADGTGAHEGSTPGSQ